MTYFSIIFPFPYRSFGSGGFDHFMDLLNDLLIIDITHIDKMRGYVAKQFYSRAN